MSKNKQAMISPSTAYQCTRIRCDSTAHELWHMKDKNGYNALSSVLRYPITSILYTYLCVCMLVLIVRKRYPAVLFAALFVVLLRIVQCTGDVLCCDTHFARRLNDGHAIGQVGTDDSSVIAVR